MIDDDSEDVAAQVLWSDEAPGPVGLRIRRFHVVRRLGPRRGQRRGHDGSQEVAPSDLGAWQLRAGCPRAAPPNCAVAVVKYVVAFRGNMLDDAVSHRLKQISRCVNQFQRVRVPF